MLGELATLMPTVYYPQPWITRKPDRTREITDAVHKVIHDDEPAHLPTI